MFINSVLGTGVVRGTNGDRPVHGGGEEEVGRWGGGEVKMASLHHGGGAWGGGVEGGGQVGPLLRFTRNRPVTAASSPLLLPLFAPT